MTLTRTGTGLLLQEGFSSLSAWTVDASSFTSVAASTLIPFGKLPTTVLSPAPGPADEINGVRQGQLYVESGVWYLLYDAGPRNNYPNAGWVQRLAVSYDRGRTWDRLGPVAGFGDGSGGTLPGAYTGWVEKRGSTYYLHRVLVSLTLACSWDIWTASSLTGPWTFSQTVAHGTGGTWNSNEHLPCSVVKDGATYYAFAQGDSTASVYKIGYVTSTTPAGPWTAQPVMIGTNAFGDSRMVENAKVFNHPTLGWVLLGNMVNAAGTWTDRNIVLVSATPTGFGSSAGHYVQRNCPADGDTNIVGVVTHITGPDGALVSDSGYVPIVYDSASNGTYFGYLPGRRIFASVLEPSTHSAHIADSSSTLKRMTLPFSHGNCEIEFAFRISTSTNTSLAFWYRTTGTGSTADGYRLVLNSNGQPLLQKVVGGSASTVATGAGTTILHDGLTWSRCRIQAVGTSHKVWIDGELYINATDAAHSSGTHVAVAAFNATGDVRLLSVRSSSTVTVASLPAGVPVALRTWGDLLVSSTVADASGVATFTVDHGPYKSFEVAGSDYAASGGVWGGDTFTLTGIPTPPTGHRGLAL